MKQKAKPCKNWVYLTSFNSAINETNQTSYNEISITIKNEQAYLKITIFSINVY